jgi:hypothetical protein
LVLSGSKIGNGLISNAVVMHFLEGMTIRQVAKIYGLPHGALLHIFHKLADSWEKVLTVLKEDYRNAPVKHADETGWRNDGKNGYAWLFCTPQLSLFQFEGTRSGEVPRSVLGESAKGVLVVDRYGGYNKVSCSIQYCYAHLLRDLQSMEKEFPKKKEVGLFVNELAPLFAKAMSLRRIAPSDSDYDRQAKAIQKTMLETCRAPAQHPAIQRYQDLILDHEHRLFHWVENQAVPPDNNRAERELRPTVIARKMSFGSQSQRGAKTRSVLMSVLHTAAKRLEDQSLRQWFFSTLEALSKNPSADLAALLPKP